MNESSAIWSGATLRWLTPLWEGRWDGPALKARKQKIGSRSFSRGYQQQTLTDEDLSFPSVTKCAEDDLDPMELLTRHWVFYSGVDQSSAKRPGQVIVTIGQRAHDRKRMVVELRAGKWTSPELWRQMEEVDRAFHPVLYMVENNAIQQAIIDWGLEMNKTLPVRGFTTGQNKADQVHGLPGLEVEFENQGWLIPRPSHSLSCQCLWCRLWVELTGHPLAISDDMVMALWFAREAARFGDGGLQWGPSPTVDHRG